MGRPPTKKVKMAALAKKLAAVEAENVAKQSARVCRLQNEACDTARELAAMLRKCWPSNYTHSQKIALLKDFTKIIATQCNVNDVKDSGCWVLPATATAASSDGQTVATAQNLRQFTFTGEHPLNGLTLSLKTSDDGRGVHRAQISDKKNSNGHFGVVTFFTLILFDFDYDAYDKIVGTATFVHAHTCRGGGCNNPKHIVIKSSAGNMFDDWTDSGPREIAFQASFLRQIAAINDYLNKNKNKSNNNLPEFPISNVVSLTLAQVLQLNVVYNKFPTRFPTPSLEVRIRLVGYWLRILEAVCIKLPSDISGYNDCQVMSLLTKSSPNGGAALTFKQLAEEQKDSQLVAGAVGWGGAWGGISIHLQNCLESENEQPQKKLTEAQYAESENEQPQKKLTEAQYAETAAAINQLKTVEGQETNYRVPFRLAMWWLKDAEENKKNNNNNTKDVPVQAKNDDDDDDNVVPSDNDSDNDNDNDAPVAADDNNNNKKKKEDKFEISHECGLPACVNTMHLRFGLKEKNTRDMFRGVGKLHTHSQLDRARVLAQQDFSLTQLMQQLENNTFDKDQLLLDIATSKEAVKTIKNRDAVVAHVLYKSFKSLEPTKTKFDSKKYFAELNKNNKNNKKSSNKNTNKTAANKTAAAPAGKKKGSNNKKSPPRRITVTSPEQPVINATKKYIGELRKSAPRYSNGSSGNGGFYNSQGTIYSSQMSSNRSSRSRSPPLPPTPAPEDTYPAIVLRRTRNRGWNHGGCRIEAVGIPLRIRQLDDWVGPARFILVDEGWQVNPAWSEDADTSAMNPVQYRGPSTGRQPEAPVEYWGLTSFHFFHQDEEDVNRDDFDVDLKYEFYLVLPTPFADEYLTVWACEAHRDGLYLIGTVPRAGLAQSHYPRVDNGQLVEHTTIAQPAPKLKQWENPLVPWIQSRPRAWVTPQQYENYLFAVEPGTYARYAGY